MPFLLREAFSWWRPLAAVVRRRRRRRQRQRRQTRWVSERIPPRQPQMERQKPGAAVRLRQMAHPYGRKKATVCCWLVLVLVLALREKEAPPPPPPKQRPNDLW